MLFVDQTPYKLDIVYEHSQTPKRVCNGIGSGWVRWKNAHQVFGEQSVENLVVILRFPLSCSPKFCSHVSVKVIGALENTSFNQLQCTACQPICALWFVERIESWYSGALEKFKLDACLFNVHSPHLFKSWIFLMIIISLGHCGAYCKARIWTALAFIFFLPWNRVWIRS